MNIRLGFVLLAIWAVAIAARQTRLAESMALADSLGPYWVGFRGPWSTTPHAEPYGWLLALPHAILVRLSSSLWSATAGIRCIDALVAPLGAWMAYNQHKRWLPTLMVGTVLALDPNLLDTATSGAEAYQAPVAIALLCVLPRYPYFAATAFVWAVMCHPLAVCAIPFLRAIRWTLGARIWLCVLLVPHVLRLAATGASAASTPQLPTQALVAWAQQGGWTAAWMVLGLLMTMHKRGRLSTGRATVWGLAGVLVAGTYLGYLRDHHLRIWSAPAAAGLSVLPNVVALAPLATQHWPASPEARPGGTRRPGTLGLLHRATTSLLARIDEHEHWVIDGVTFAGPPAIEPGGVWLDLLLHDVSIERLDVADGHQVAVIVTAARGDMRLQSPSEYGMVLVDTQDTWAIWYGTPAAVSAWTQSWCGASRDARTGGAWDGLVLTHPHRGAASVQSWWDCKVPDSTSTPPGTLPDDTLPRLDIAEP